MATVHSYKRFSTPEQAEGDSERRQDDAAARFCKAHKHKLSSKKFFDKGKSSWKGDKQKALKAFLRAVDEGEVKAGDILLVEAIDRLSRKGIRETQNLVNSILDRGIDIAIISPLEKVYKASAKNDLGDTIELAAFAYSAYIYSKMLSNRIKEYRVDQRKKIRDKGEKFAGNCPNWLKWNKDQKAYEEIPEASETIKFIFQRTIEGIGAPLLCKELNAKYPLIGTRKNSKSWNKVYVRQILTSRRIMGEYQPTVIEDDTTRCIPIGDPIPNYYPAIVSEETWLAAQSAISNRKIERGPRTDFVNLWTGIVQHAIDKAPLHIYSYQQKRADGRRVIFRRLKSQKAVNNEPGASTETIGIEDFDHALLNCLHELDPSVLTGKKPKLDLSAKRAALAKKQKRIAELNQALETGDEEVGTLLNSIKNLKADVKTMDTELRKLATEANTDQAINLAQVRKLVKEAVTPVQRQLLSEAIKRVVSRVTVLPVKLGKLRRSPIACVAEIEFHGNNYWTTVLFCGKQYDFWKTPKNVSTPMADKPAKEIKKLYGDFVKHFPKLLRIESLSATA